ncbi:MULTISPECIES: flagellar basal body rod protein FlgB [Enterobacter cloacae complex]|uniref:Flagellar basal body rod protein FlgB n=2 Tax=Enterobacter cloacae complex TaxID=354276 RepID=A0A7H8UB27_ENTCL|nr:MULTISPECIES: flagellar basal body rod protein FlgB [Enterobacter cloacae complex]MBE4864044.1 flagellar basal body rod protein FlgB [Enterobacter cloacae complex sp. P40C2]MBE4876242.1 flagellar basal body rod protein FlgB [Enterobacter cloacae complex sp. P40C]MCM7514386.1 flagellar basal body rod protein FlgB [Enterobacter hormaechei]MBE4854308.1 flagellar basal body rod protein FlgB [Enterobacter pasteurii]MCY0773331.1 flagellar basal body rod protein FlgB [Enterobacter cloacae complex 
MSITFDKALGVHPQAVALRLSRAELLSANLANVDTPNFQAKDIDFASEMQRSRSSFSFSSAPQEMYRVPYQPSSDGNTVSLNVEQAEFAKNTQDYQMSLAFLNMKFTGLKKAIDGK